MRESLVRGSGEEGRAYSEGISKFYMSTVKNGSLRLCAISTRLDYTRLSTVICKCQTGSKKRCRSVISLFRMHGDMDQRE
jgi:hypothetical protein